MLTSNLMALTFMYNTPSSLFQCSHTLRPSPSNNTILHPKHKPHLPKLNISQCKMTKMSLPPTPIFLFLLFTLLSYHGNSQNNSLSGQELSLLLQLKQHWSNPPPLTHWTNSSDQCTWPEITCINGSVTGIDLNNLNITESIPPFICDLTSLTSIDFQYNYFPGTFPTLFYNCTNLQYLDLSGNYFVGTLPDDIDRLSPRLEYLNLGFNNFTGDIPASIGRLRSLKRLHLDSCMYNGTFPPEIGDLVNLEELVMSENMFAPQPIPSSFTRMQKLRNFWMTGTNLIGEIPDSIGNMSALESLDLSVNSLTGNIPDGLFLLTNLTNLYLYKNRLSGTIPQRVEVLQLQVLDLSYNNLTGTIPEEFGNLMSLTGFALFVNELSGEIPVSMGRLPGIVDFGVYSNNLSGELPPDFGRFSMLKTFQVSSNRFSGVLPSDLCANNALRGLIAFENQLTGGLPESLGNCSGLVIVRVHDNRLSGEIPHNLWTTFNFTHLMISNNLFTGQLPEEVSSTLSLVELSNNLFSGPIPVQISSWNNLTVFRGSNNSFSGVIPQELTALASLSTLELDGNQLSGPLPSNIISWVSLTTLDLSRNQLSGQIPASVGLLTHLAYLDLSANEFSGRIPPQMGSLRLPSLNLSSNRLSGTIPREYENGAFHTSFLNNSGLCSDIPSVGIGSCNPRTIQTTRKPSPHFIAAVSSIAAAAFLVTFLYSVYVYRKYRNKKHIMDSNWKLTSFQRLSFTETDVLSSLTEDNMIGSGGSGRVYRVPINSSGEYVAVKKIWDNVDLNQKLEKEFLAEVEILGSIRHSNTVKLLCCISSENSKLLVYEYVQNRSLDRWLHKKRRQLGSVHHQVLDWPKRLQIAIGAAQGLCYMHHDCLPPIIHRDVKSSNILLDKDFNAKIADFGLARILMKSGEPNTMSVVAGSFGYMAPEYTQTKRVDEKIDVYSFGVVLLELVTGMEANYGDETSSLAGWVWSHIHEGRSLADAVDEDINEPEFLEEINSVLNLGIICTSRYPSSRPAMKDVLQVLLRCSGNQPFMLKRSEKDIAPLLHNSKLQSSVKSDDSLFSSLV